ncbi:helix-turn-helix domain-containing protein [Piscirickettsia salmonis]|uniref:helix-turn-helix domain-containing protein n=1 Tax=Piscirickettsia salmonis TaxID=1238 RepID=UPI0012BA9081|nr:helix-turn-helix transcriptional regulator [Piscirickettsia salmonis]QGP41352.1 Helix-turn-helix protein [Piscirickettsia salmonis]
MSKRPTHDEFLKKALTKPGVQAIYDDLDEEYQLIRELLLARKQANKSQEEVAQEMHTTRSAISRLESHGKNSPSISTLRKYAEAVGCKLQIRLIPAK